jgi:hypothetical protein
MIRIGRVRTNIINFHIFFWFSSRVAFSPMLSSLFDAPFALGLSTGEKVSTQEVQHIPLTIRPFTYLALREVMAN